MCSTSWRRTREAEVFGDMTRDQKTMPDVPHPDYVGMVCEIWFTVNYAAYHLAYTRVYLQTRSMQTQVKDLLRDEQSIRDQGQVDLIICRSHLASFFWQLDHVFETLDIAIKRGQKEFPEERYFHSQEQALKKVRETSLPKEIAAYRNEGHNIPGIIGQKWSAEHKFLHHFLPTIQGYEAKEDRDINDQLQIYFEYVANAWRTFVPEQLREQFPRNFAFPVTVPFQFLGELPKELASVPQLQIELEAYDKDAGTEAAASPTT
jgi:hypothetical protein